MSAFFERALSLTLEESLQHTSIARSGSPHNALYSLVYLIVWYMAKLESQYWLGIKLASILTH